MGKNLSRREFVGRAGMGLAGILASGISPACSSGRGNKPNIVLVTMDTTRYDRMGFNGHLALTRDGNLESTTPYLDSIAKKGVVFDSNYCQANMTPLSIGSLLTSMYVRESKEKLNNPSLKNKVTLAEVLRENSYQTCGGVSSFILNSRNIFNRGFDHFSDTQEQKRLGEETLEEIKSRLSSINPQKPYFIWYHTFDPHIPYNAPDEFKLRFHTRGEFDDTRKVYLCTNKIGESSKITENQVRKFLDQYYGQLYYADRNIKNLISYLEDNLGFRIDRDLVVITSDHGENMGEHGECCLKDGLYETIIHTPLVLSGAGLPGRRRIFSLTENLDVMPTILDIAGVDIPETCKGSSLVPLTRGEKNKVKEFATTDDLYLNAFSIRAKGGKLGNMKYIHRELLGSSTVAEKIEGYYPTGNVDFPDSGKFLFKWPKEIMEGGLDRPFELVLENDASFLFSYIHFKGRYNRGILDSDQVDVIGLEGDSYVKNMTWRFFGENMWNVYSSYNIHFRWDIRRDGKSLIPDARKLEFSPNPSRNFRELFDLQVDPEEMKNLIAGSSENVLKFLRFFEIVAKKHYSRRGMDDLEESPFGKLSRDKREKLRSLGYLP